MRLRRKRLVVALSVGAPVLAVVAAIAAFGPIVRSVVATAAARRHLRVEVGSVRPSWRGVTLGRVRAVPDGMTEAEARVDEVRIALGWGLRLENVRIVGANVTVSGAAGQIRGDWDAWRARAVDKTGATASRPRPRVSVEGMAVRWENVGESGGGAGSHAEIRGVDASWDPDGVRVAVSQGQGHAGPWSVSFDQAVADVGADGKLRRARAAALLVDWLAPEGRSSPAISDPEPPSPPPASVSGSAKAARLEAPASASLPLLPFPDSQAWNAKIRALGALLSDRIGQGADLGVDALTWRIGRANGEKDAPALTGGPGPLSAIRSPYAVEVRFSADPALATTPLTVGLWIPTDAADASLTLDGGPVSLSLLGIREGAAGLVDVARARVAGRGRVVLASDGGAITFDGELAATGLSIQNGRLASDVVRDLDLRLRGRGVLTSDGQLRVDDLGVTVGALTLSAAGHLEQTPDHVSGAFRFESPTASCQALLDGMPAALLPELRGARVTGTFDAQGRVAFDTRALDDLQLDYAMGDHCRLFDVPPWLARTQFEHAFSYRIYLPDGSVAEQTTGPGTSNWTSIEDISPYMQVAVLTTEDGAFPRHHGFNRTSIRASLIANLKARRFVRGASTITMQLAKNLFLSRDKTLSRKLEEVVLTEYLEQTFSKDELMELYLNVIEFGPAVYGITAAADYYFGRTPAELNLAECLFLSSLLPAPRRYGAMREQGEVSDGWMRTLHTFMEVARRTGRITDAELGEGESEPVVFWNGSERPPPRPVVQARPRLDGDTDDVSTVPDEDEQDKP